MLTQIWIHLPISNLQYLLTYHTMFHQINPMRWRSINMWDTFVGGELLRLWFYTMSYNNNSLIYEHSGAEHSIRKVGLRWSQALSFCTSHLADASWLVVHTVWFTTSAVKFRDKPYQHRIYDMFIHVLYANSWSFAYRLYRVAWLIWTGKRMYSIVQ